MKKLLPFGVRCCWVLVIAGCDVIADDPELVERLCFAAVPYYGGADCTHPETQAKVKSVLTDGIVSGQLECNGVAFGPAGKVVFVYYNAVRYQDGACQSRADLTAPPTQSSGSNAWGRAHANSDTCLVKSFHPPQLLSTTWVENGVVNVQSPFCTPGVCTMPVAGNCVLTGDSDAF